MKRLQAIIILLSIGITMFITGLLRQFRLGESDIPVAVTRDTNITVGLTVSGVTNITMTNLAFAQEPPSLDANDLKYWLSKIKIYQCPDGLFEVNSVGVSQGKFSTIEEARDRRLLIAFTIWDRRQRGRSVPHQEPCGELVDSLDFQWDTNSHEWVHIATNTFKVNITP